MKVKLCTAAALTTVLALSVGCLLPLNSAVFTTPHNWVKVPALPIIQSAVFSLVPTFAGKRNRAAMQQVCTLARGDATQDQVNAKLRQMGINPDVLPRSDEPLSLLVNGNRAAQATACAAYEATNVLMPVDTDAFLRRVELSAEEAASGENSNLMQIDQERLGQILPVMLAEARANADVFSLIATEMQRRPGLTTRAYADYARELFARLAPTYLQRLKEQTPADNVRYTLERMEGNNFVFSTDTGIRFEYQREGLRLRQNDMPWFGEGKIMGQFYTLQVAYFDTSVSTLLGSSDP